MTKIINFFDRLEDRLRGYLSKYPIVYTLVGGIAVVLFWRGVWMTADLIPFLTGPVSIFISVGVLLVTGLFVSFFIQDDIIRSGLKQEKKLVEKTQEEVEQEMDILAHMDAHLEKMEQEIQNLKKRKA